MEEVYNKGIRSERLAEEGDRAEGTTNLVYVICATRWHEL